MITPLGSRASIGYGLGMSRPVSASASWWLTGGISPANCIAAYQPKGAASLAASYVNLANPGTYDAAPGVAPSFDAGTGWTFDGSTQYLLIGFQQAQGMTGIVRFSNFSIAGRILAGSRGEPRFYYQPNYVGTITAGYGQGNATAAGVTMTAGVIALAGGYLYRDGSLIAQQLVWSGSQYQIVAIGGVNRNTGVDTFAAVEIQAAAFYDITLSGPQVAALTTAMAAL